jgi:hypothetical protein
MNRRLVFSAAGAAHYKELKLNPAEAGTFKQVRKTLKLLEQDTRHPGLKTHEYDGLRGANGERVWEAYAQNKTAGAYRVFFHYGPDELVEGKRVPVLTIVAITPHP